MPKVNNDLKALTRKIRLGVLKRLFWHDWTCMEKIHLGQKDRYGLQVQTLLPWTDFANPYFHEKSWIGIRIVNRNKVAEPNFVSFWR